MILQRMRHTNARKRYARHPYPEPALEQLLQSSLHDPARPWIDQSWLAIDLETTDLELLNGYIVSMGWVAIENGNIRLDSARHLLIDSRNLVGNSATIHQIRDADLDRGVPIQSALLALACALTDRIPVVHHRPLDEGFLRLAYEEQFGFPFTLAMADTLALEKKRLSRRPEGIRKGALRLTECRRRYNLPDYPVHNALTDAISCAELFIAWARHFGGRGPAVRDCL